MVGTTLGQYRIVRLLGRGGMGDVYLADDSRLGRQVALKVLSSALHADAGRRDRFEREARAVAALNHPNIVTLHSIDQAGGTPFLTMEYVEGRPLGDLIPSTGLPLDRLLTLAIPLADAVGAAHHRGILHRDLKPANVMVTPDGRVKVLDFGLAKLQADGGPTADALPTQELTGEGRIVGTVAYMSPEQAEGKPVDQRSDVFSLGVLLYELATGRRPFTGDTSLSVLSAILKDTPRPMAELRVDLPRDFTRIVSRALNKDPEARYQSAKDLRNDLQAVRDDLSSGDLARSSATAPAVAVPTPAASRRSLWQVAAMAAMALASIGGAWFALRPRSTPMPAPAVRDIWSPQRLTSSGTVRPFVAMSPDGRYVAYPEVGAGGQRLALRQIATNSVVELRPFERVNVNGVTFSPDGEFLYYSYYPAGNNMATLYRMPSIGGTSVRVTENVDTPVAISPDGSRLAFAVNYPQTGLSVMEVARSDGSERRALAELKRPDQFVPNRRPSWSPDRSTIAAPMVSGGGQTVALIDTATGAVRPVGTTRWAGVMGVAWDRDGHALLVAIREEGAAAGQLWRLDATTGAITPITRDLFNYNDVTMSADGRQLVAIIGLAESTIWAADARRLGEPAQLTTGSGDAEGFEGIAGLADGHIVFTARTSGNPDLWTLDPRSGARRTLTTDPADDVAPVASPDGKQLAFVSARDGRRRIWLMNMDGSEQRALTPGPADSLPVWTPDASSILYITNMRPMRIAATGGEPEPLSGYWPARPGEPAKTFYPRTVSPKGVAAGFEVSDVNFGGGWRLAFAPLDGSAPVRLLAPSYGSMSAIAISWSPDGTAIDVAAPQPGANVMRFPIDGRPGAPLVIIPRSLNIRAAAWAFDRQRLLLSLGEVKSDVVLLRRSDGR
jgi:Tol biopolymer transport system component/predicted Ser/Thr protein kinase